MANIKAHIWSGPHFNIDSASGYDYSIDEPVVCTTFEPLDGGLRFGISHKSSVSFALTQEQAIALRDWLVANVQDMSKPSTWATVVRVDEGLTGRPIVRAWLDDAAAVEWTHREAPVPFGGELIKAEGEFKPGDRVVVERGKHNALYITARD
jgi:hypothetical protein